MSSTRDRTLQHLKRLAAAATVVSAGTTNVSACKKEAVKPGDDAATGEKDKDSGSTVSTNDFDATAPSTQDSATFVESNAKDASDWRVVPPNTGYAVVDPMPPPTRIPPIKKDGGRHK